MSARPLTNHHCALLAGGDAVTVAFEQLLGNPADDRRSVLGALELLYELRFEVCDV
ncbi:MAG: hypothetical protein JWQ04_1232 [Pedosphaera sp.]|nr:hypothetical protein [Pedosphaera sp.]